MPTAIAPKRLGTVTLLAVLAVAVCLLSEPAAAQVLYGTVLGNVRDKSGGAVPGASVNLTSKATGLSKQTKTTEAGSYVFSDLLPGDYNIEVVAQVSAPPRIPAWAW